MEGPEVNEDKHQEALAQWLDLRGLRWFHPPNGGQRNRIVAGKLKAQGVKAGVPDVIITTPVPNRPEVRGVALELKTEKGRLSSSQRQWLDGLEADGWVCLVGYGRRDAVAHVEKVGL